ncbi:Xenobiotic-transporting ATPase [Handroanthus impetiginosus]|uniref:Xenobiotic-transporting ATPase n=1 Tax=Handroanthus impetiginosus TaxID=429701 RepID=A0A2G9HM10_9LAMI|nr:Xenobiotic-transporting ATPase [Handroanthus impetiginosus]
MASSAASWGEFSWLHGEILGEKSSNTLRTILDYLNLFEAFVFYIVFLITKKSSSSERRRGWFNIGISGFCALVSIEYFAAIIYFIISKTKGLNHLNWIELFVRGLIWLALSISELVRGSKWITVLKSSWWIVFFVFVSLLKITNLVKSRSIEILEVAPWIGNLLIFICGLRNL